MVGILGCSDIARRKFIPALTDCKHARLAALASRDRVRAAMSFPADAAVALLTYHELVCNNAIDLVYVSLPNHLHEEWCIRALEQGKHVICEKPLGLGIGSVNNMLAAADRRDRLLYENIMYLQHPQHRAVKALIATGRIGRILSLRSVFTFPGPAKGDFRLDPACGGGAFHDLNRYPLSAALYFLEGKTHHSIRGIANIKKGLTLSFQADSVTEAAEKFSFLIAFGQPYRSAYEIMGEHGSIRVERAFTTPADMENRIYVMINNRDESFNMPPGDHFLGSIDYACNLIRSGTWSKEHERTKKLAELAGLFHDQCIRRGA